jgi:toxin ParE1/3/4
MTRHKRRLVWSADAENDLFSIWRYGAERWSPTAADDHERALWYAAQWLLEKPKLGKARNELMPGMRSVFIDPHVLFYRISPKSIDIVRVPHEHEDIETIFN